MAFRHAHPCLAAGEKGAPAKFIKGLPDGVLGFTREADGDAVTVIANLTPERVVISTYDLDIALDPWDWFIK